mmetsp:Transcript_817/g.1857  ORF Transcript_817/g.1857 Transcript_817/m.1857 type:complete len:210 (-) Transcript_817:37-666(-)
MPYFVATFSEVMPMGMRHETAMSLSKIAPENLFGSMPSPMGNMLMDSTPPAKPTSMMPALMLEATLATAWRPLLHWRFTVCMGMSKGKPPKNWPMRPVTAPAPGCEALPIWMSPMAFGSTFVRSMVALKRGAKRSSQAVSLKAPRFAFVIGVRNALQITTSSSDLAASLMLALVASALRGDRVAGSPGTLTCCTSFCKRSMARTDASNC